VLKVMLATIIVLLVTGLLLYLSAGRSRQSLLAPVAGETSNNGVTPATPPNIPQRARSVEPPATMSQAREPVSPTMADHRDAETSLRGWVAALNAHDLEAHLSYFADQLDVYYSARNVSVDRVRATLTRAFLKYSDLDVRMSNLTLVDDSPTSVVATFDKSWQFQGPAKPWSGTVREQVWLKKLGGRWRIVGLKDL